MRSPGRPLPGLVDSAFPTNAPVDLYVGPTAPKDGEGRWIKTEPGHGWFAYIRIHSPEQAAFDKGWKPGDFEQVK